MTTFTPLCYSVKPIESNHPKCNDLAQGITSEKRSRHAFFLAESLLNAISTLHMGHELTCTYSKQCL